MDRLTLVLVKLPLRLKKAPYAYLKDEQSQKSAVVT